MAVRQFYQIYRDAETIFELFDIDLAKVREKIEKTEAKDAKGLIFAAVLKSFHALIREFHGGQLQYKIYLMDGTEIKISNPFGCRPCSKYFIQVSAGDPATAEVVFQRIMERVKKFFADGKEVDAE